MIHSNVLAMQVDSPEVEELARQAKDGDAVDQLLLLAAVCEDVAEESDDDVLMRMADKFRRAVEKRHEELRNHDDDGEDENRWY